MNYQDLFLELEEKIVLSVKEMFDYLLENQIKIFAFAVNISDDLAYLGFPANSIKNIDHQYKWFHYEFDLELTTECDKIYQNVKEIDHLLEQINELVGNSFENFEEELYEKTKKDIIFCVTNALKKIKNQLGSEVADIVFFIAMDTADDAQEIKNNSARILNDEKIITDFLQR